MAGEFVLTGMERLGLDQREGNVWETESGRFTLELTGGLLPKWKVTNTKSGEAKHFTSLRETIAYMWAVEDLLNTPLG